MQSESSGQSPACYVCGNPAGRYSQRVKDGYFMIKCQECEVEYTAFYITSLYLAVSLLYGRAWAEIAGGQP